MATFSLYYPAKPYVLTQAWGIYDPKDYSQFGFTNHNGNDIALGTDKKLYAPFPYTVVRIGNQPNGGGIFFGIMSEPYTWKDGTYRVLLDMLHCEKILCTEGQTGGIGDVLAIADNTGFSTGPHTHLQARRALNWNNKSGDALSWTPKDKNDANGSFDLVPYWNGLYASDYKPVETVWVQPAPVSLVSQENTVQNLTEQVSLLQQVINLLKKLLTK